MGKESDQKRTSKLASAQIDRVIKAARSLRAVDPAPPCHKHKRGIDQEPCSGSHLAQVTSDPADNIFIECVDAARADYLVMGDQRHFPKFWKNTKIISSSEFLSVIAPHLLR
jgi:predicted nucleic acid-binding protein